MKIAIITDKKKNDEWLENGCKGNRDWVTTINLMDIIEKEIKTKDIDITNIEVELPTGEVLGYEDGRLTVVAS